MSTPRAPRKRSAGHGDGEDDEDERGFEWLLRNARELRIAAEREQETGSWDRGRTEERRPGDG